VAGFDWAPSVAQMTAQFNPRPKQIPSVLIPGTQIAPNSCLHVLLRRVQQIGFVENRHPLTRADDWTLAMDTGMTMAVVSTVSYASSKNLAASPIAGPLTSPSHITFCPRTKVPTGQPVTFFPL
jgi:hypothetical protein